MITKEQVEYGAEECAKQGHYPNSCKCFGEALQLRAEKAEARVVELEAFVRPFAESGHDIECECDRGPCTCAVGPAQRLIRGEWTTDSVSEERCCYGCNDPATVVRGAFAFCDSCDPNGKPVATPDPISDDGGWNDATRANRAAAFPASDADYDYREHLGEDDGG